MFKLIEKNNLKKHKTIALMLILEYKLLFLLKRLLIEIYVT